MSNFGSRLRHALGAFLLLGFALGAWAVTITLNGGVNGSVTCTATSDIAVSATGDVTANVISGTDGCNLHGTPSAPTVQTGGDPGSGVWISGNNYVHDRGGLSELFVPRCVPSQYTNCRYAGGSSRFDTVKAGQVWAMRIPTATSGFAATTYIFGVQRAETGETLTGFDYAISATVGDFNVTSGCKGSGAGTLKVYGVGSGYTPSLYSPSCPLTPGTRYYLNVRPQTGSVGATLCGSSATNACRYRIVLPSGFPYSP